MSKLHDRVRKRKSKLKIKLITSMKKKRKPKRYKLNDKTILKAIPGTFGSIGMIAARLNRPYSSIQSYFYSRAPDHVKEALREERERMVDIAEETNLEMMTQRYHFPTALRASHFTLTHHPDADKKGYKEKKELTLQGGDKPIKLENENIMSIDRLKNIPLDVREQMLEEMKEEEEKDENNV